MRKQRSDDGQGGGIGSRFNPLLVALTAAVVSFAVLSGVALLAYRTQESRSRAEARVTLSRVAHGDAAVIGYWVAESESDLHVLASTSRVRSEFESYLKGDDSSEAWLKMRLEAERASRNYVNITVFDTKGVPRLTLGGDSHIQEAELSRLAVQAAQITTGSIGTGHPAAADSYHMAWFAPLRITEEPGRERVTGVVMYEADLRPYLKSVVTSVRDPWPVDVALLIGSGSGAYVASATSGFRFATLPGPSYPGGDVLAENAQVGSSQMRVIASVSNADLVDSLAWERRTIAALDALVFLVFAAFVWGFARSERDRRYEARARAEIRDAMETQDRFLANMSHDLRTPLNSVIGFSSVLKSGLAGPLNDEQLRQVSMIEASGKHLLALVTDVLELSKIKAGKEEVDLEVVSVAQIVRFVSDVLSPQVAEKELTWTSDVPEGFEIITDRRLVERVLLNLAGNAVKFTVNGGVSVTARKHAGEIVIAVHDTGPGIDYGLNREIMKEFRQLYRSRSVKPDGTGLGLAICEKTAKLLGGSIRVDSTPGVGSTFALVLPATSAVS